jgi:Tol biopolymer transport system component
MKQVNFLKRISIIISAILIFLGGTSAETRAAAVRSRPVSVSPSGEFGTGHSFFPQVSADGRFIAFSSESTNLIPGLNDPNGDHSDVFVRDLETGALRCLSTVPNGASTGNGASFDPRISADGRYVIFTSLASDLSTLDNNSRRDVYRSDLQTGTLELVSVNSAGSAAGNGDSFNPEMNASGRFVLITSYSTDLLNGFVDGNGPLKHDYFVRDMQTGTTRLISAAPSTTLASVNGGATESFTYGARPYQIDAAGRYIVFLSDATDVIVGLNDMNGNSPDIFVRDMQRNETTPVSVTPDGFATGNSYSFAPQITADGRRVFFDSFASNLGSNDANNAADIYSRNLNTGRTQLVSLNVAGARSGNGQSTGGISNGTGYSPISVTPDGRYVVFTSLADDLVDGYSFSGGYNVFVRDMLTETTRLASVAQNGVQAANGSAIASNHSSISNDGRFVVFSSQATNLAAPDTNGQYDIFVRDMQENITTLASTNFSGTNGGNGLSAAPVVAGNARRVVFGSVADNLAAGDNNNKSDIFYADFGRRRAVSDFDGDGRTDFGVFRPSEGIWYVLPGTTGFVNIRQWGQAGDRVVPADYDGDGRDDHAVFRASEGKWYLQHSVGIAAEVIHFGLPGDIPAPADFDGDEKADIAVFRPSDGIWYIRQSSNGQVRFQNWGLNGDLPVAGDYDGDGKADVAVFRPSERTWYILRSTDNSFISLLFGLSSDRLVPADYDGDGRTDIAVFRPSDGTWHIFGTQSGYYSLHWGLADDIPAPGIFDGDGKTDIAVFRPATGDWYVLQSSTGSLLGIHWGIDGDVPLTFIQ